MTVKELRDILKDFDDDVDVMAKDHFGAIGHVNSARKDSYSHGFFGADIPCVMLSDEFEPQESEVRDERD